MRSSFLLFVLVGCASQSPSTRGLVEVGGAGTVEYIARNLHETTTEPVSDDTYEMARRAWVQVHLGLGALSPVERFVNVVASSRVDGRVAHITVTAHRVKLPSPRSHEVAFEDEERVVWAIARSLEAATHAAVVSAR